MDCSAISNYKVVAFYKRKRKEKFFPPLLFLWAFFQQLNYAAYKQSSFVFGSLHGFLEADISLNLEDSKHEVYLSFVLLCL